MDDGRINAALRHTMDTRNVVLGARTLSAMHHVFAQCFGAQPALVVADKNIFTVAGKAGAADPQPINRFRSGRGDWMFRGVRGSTVRTWRLLGAGCDMRNVRLYAAAQW
jgi:hypothetical protein